MAFPGVLRRLFENDGAGPKLRSDIMPGSIAADGIPAGVICMWSGTVATVPGGWALCNGASGTPNLCDRFIVGAGAAYAPKATGGANTHAHTATAASVAAATAIGSTAAGATIGATTLTTAQMPSHTHKAVTSGTSSSSLYSVDRGGSILLANTGATGGGGSHTHTATGTAHTHTATGTAHTHTLTVAAGSNVPLYYALAYIMKL